MEKLSKQTPVFRPLVYSILFWIIGIYIGDLRRETFLFWWSIGFTNLAIWGICWFYRWRGWIFPFSIALLFLGAAWGSVDVEQQKLDKKYIKQFIYQSMLWEGVVVGKVSYRWKKTLKKTNFCSKINLSRSRLVLDDKSMLQMMKLQLFRVKPSSKKPWRHVHSMIQLTVLGNRFIERGSYLRIRAVLRPVLFYGNPGAFDARSFWARRGIFFRMSCSQQAILPLGFHPQSHIARAVDRYRNSLNHWINTLIPHPKAAGLLQALLLGDRSSLHPVMKKAFSRTGTAHLLAISGLHLAIISSLVWSISFFIISRFRWLVLYGWSHRIASLFTFIAAVSYTALSGWALSTQRALIMVTIFLGGSFFLRTREISTTLSLAAFFILLSQPSSLFMLSFQLSFISVIALVYGGKSFTLKVKLNNNTSNRWKKYSLQLLHWLSLSFFSSSLAIIATLPVTLAFFPSFPLWGPIVNIIAVPIGGFLVVGLGMLAIMLSFWSVPLANFLLQCAGECARLLIWIVEFFASLPGANLTLPPFHFGESFCYYTFFAGVLFWKKKRSLAILCLISALSFYSFLSVQKKFYSPPKAKLLLHFIDVGQGDSSLIQFPNGKNMLIDAGGSLFGSFDVGEKVVYPYLRYLRISRLDFVVLTHPHPDHFGGLPFVVKKLPVGQFWHTGEKSHHPYYLALMGILKKKNTPIKRFLRYKKIRVGQVMVEILHPLPKTYEGNSYYWALHANNNSLVLLITDGKTKILMTGDIEKRGEELLIKRWSNLHVDILKVPHHGSNTSSTPLLLDRVHPSHALFGVGRGNQFHFPHKKVLHRYRKRKIHMWQTAKHGRILISSDGNNFTFSTFLNTTAKAMKN